MAKQIYIDENGNPIEVSGTINTAELLPISGNDPTDTKTYIDGFVNGIRCKSVTIPFTFNNSPESNPENLVSASGIAENKIINVLPYSYGIAPLCANVSSGGLIRVRATNEYSYSISNYDVKVLVFYID